MGLVQLHLREHASCYPFKRCLCPWLISPLLPVGSDVHKAGLLLGPLCLFCGAALWELMQLVTVLCTGGRGGGGGGGTRGERERE